MKIDKENLFKEKLMKGINLFTGAGFSCLPNEKGQSLPTAQGLAQEISSKFPLPESIKDDLAAACEIISKDSLQQFLRERFRVTSYNPAYDIINKINMRSLITTNIDNIIQNVIKNGNNYYLHSIIYYGDTKRGLSALPFIPLHGDIERESSYLYFGKFELANVDNNNRNLFEMMDSYLSKYPTLFWGYSFQDSGVLRTVSKLLETSPQDIWIQCLPNDKKTIDIFRAKNCNIIQADTNELLQWIKINISTPCNQENPMINMNILRPYLIPTLQEIPTKIIEDFYQKGETSWHPILTKQAAELSIINDIYDKSLQHKNIIILGNNFTGKTTALMQLALKIDAPNKLYLKDITKEEAIFILKHITKQAYVFFHSCTDDIETYKLFAKHPNIRTIGISKGYQFDICKHLLDDIELYIQEVGELSPRDAKTLFQTIPSFCKKEKQLVYKETPYEKFSMLEMISQNVRNVPTRERIKKLLIDIKNKNYRSFQAILLTTYLENHKSALSMDILFSFFNLTSYSEAKAIIEETQKLLNTYDIHVSAPTENQDFFIIRSKLFLRETMQLLQKDNILKQEFSKIINKFIKEVNQFKIYNYHIFRQKAYDSKFFYRIFGKHATSIYNFLYNYEKNPYILQQKALYLSLLENYDQAFVDIEKALQACPHNFSMLNSRAIIFFEANKDKVDPEALRQKTKAMDLLENCYINDKRKDYHAYKYAEFAVHLAKHQECHYLDKAIKWLEEIKEKALNRKKAEKLLEDLRYYQKFPD